MPRFEIHITSLHHYPFSYHACILIHLPWQLKPSGLEGFGHDVLKRNIEVLKNGLNYKGIWVSHSSAITEFRSNNLLQSASCTILWCH